MIMKTILNIAVLGILLAFGPKPCFAAWAIGGHLSKQQAKEMGMEIRSKTNGTNEVSVELEIKTEGELSSVGQVGSRVELKITKGERCLLSATLKEDRSQPGRVIVSFAADRAHLEMATLHVWVGGGVRGMGGARHELRVKDFVELGKVRYYPHADAEEAARLARDLAEARLSGNGKANRVQTFGPVIECVLPSGAPCREQYFQFQNGKVYVVGNGPGTTKEEYERDWKRAEDGGGRKIRRTRLWWMPGATVICRLGSRSPGPRIPPNNCRLCSVMCWP
jgi:hypothetical protein